WNPRRPSYVLASASRDGGLAASAAEGVGFRKPVRGSSARGGATALRQLHRVVARRNASVAVVCDGPRPPARKLAPGVLHLARASGLPIWLVRTSYRPANVLERTWARFLLPPPWAHAVSLADGPIVVPPDTDREGLERLRAATEDRLNRLADRADEIVG
ncbi:MAG: lysophospholipid acyltransferase family protein, partial [Planctomycetota bacterium]